MADFGGCSANWGCNCSNFASAYTSDTGNPAPFSCTPPTGNPSNLDETKLLMEDFVPGGTGAYSQWAQTITTQMYMSSVDVPDEDFYAGMTDINNNPITYDGNLLAVDFALFMQGNIMLNSGDSPGYYEFALISDDGSILYLNNSSTPWINNDGSRSNTLACASTTISLQIGQPVPLQLNYFEGPAYYIASMLLWRKLPSAAIPTNDNTSSLCGFVADNGCYGAASATQAGSKSDASDSSCVNKGVTASLYTLYNDGWSPVPAANLYLPGTNATNPCTSSSSSGGSGSGS